MIDKNFLDIEIPNGFYNVGISIDNFLIADTNNSANWDTIKFPLPDNNWKVYRVDGKDVRLSKIAILG